MRASIGFRAGPVRVSSGNLLHSKRRRPQRPRRREGAMGSIFAMTFLFGWYVIKYSMLFLWWFVVGAWQGGVWLTNRVRAGRS
jgi:hypothetical protein